ncbi:MAG TPA: PEGA domain-containing protein, partial [Nitrospirota bacterium]
MRALLGGLFVMGVVFSAQAQEAEPDLVIVKYGKILVKSTLPDARVYVDDVYKGRADSVIENIMVGERVISCRTESQTVSGTFTVRKDEVLKLEARFNEGRLASHVERIEMPVEEAKPKPPAPKPPAAKPEKPKKPVVAAKKEEHKSPEEERRELHLNVFKVVFENGDNNAVRVTNKINAKVISKFTEKKDQTGTYYRTKQGILLCDAGPCERQWSATFVYTDEEGKGDAFGLTWKETVFNGITPQGTSRRDLVFCLSGVCKNFADVTAADVPQQLEVGRYHVTWSRSSLIIRRSDIMKEV